MKKSWNLETSKEYEPWFKAGKYFPDTYDWLCQFLSLDINKKINYR
jgi:hypothetical protein